MVKFDFKKAADKLPPEPVPTLEKMMEDKPGLTKREAVMYFYENYDPYACRLAGDPSPVPENLFYVGNKKWMDGTGHVYRRGAVESWDSYTELEGTT